MQRPVKQENIEHTSKLVKNPCIDILDLLLFFRIVFLRLLPVLRVPASRSYNVYTMVEMSNVLLHGKLPRP